MFGRILKSSIIPFVTKKEFEDKEIEIIRNTPAFVAVKTLTKEEKKELEKKKKGYWNTWNLIPTEEEGYTKVEEIEHSLGMMCFIVADEKPSEYHRLYHKSTLLEVYKLMMYKRAKNW